MRGIIFYYSGTGNTALACEYMARRLPVPLDCVDVTAVPRIDLGRADVVGFATPTDFWGIPYVFEAFVEGLPRQDGKPAFVFNTFGAGSGKTLRVLARAVEARGFSALAGYSLRMPESYPPAIASGKGAADAPGRKEMAGFDSFISELAGILHAGRDDGHFGGAKLRLGLMSRFLPDLSRTAARDDMGEKHVDALVCTECGLCERNCPYVAIKLEPKPTFDSCKCYGCWRCYNLCPAHAIYTGKFRTGPFYPGPSELLKAKLRA